MTAFDVLDNQLFQATVISVILYFCELVQATVLYVLDWSYIFLYVIYITLRNWMVVGSIHLGHQIKICRLSLRFQLKVIRSECIYRLRKLKVNSIYALVVLLDRLKRYLLKFV